MSKSLLRLVVLSAPLVLTACGEGWETQRMESYMPYGNSRTAGTGVAYVRAKMLPKRELVVEPVLDEVKAEPEVKVELSEVAKPVKRAEPEPVLEAEDIFTKAQHKAKLSKSPHEESSLVQEELDSIKAAAYFPSEADDDVSYSAGVREGDGGMTPMLPAAGLRDEDFGEEHSSFHDGSYGEMSEGDEYIVQASKTIITPKVEVIKSPPRADSIASARIRSYDSEVAHPAKRIVVPKRDGTGQISAGEEELSEIYNQPF